MILTQRNLHIASILFGLITAMLSFAMLSIFPTEAQLRDGFTTPIIAFEFARSDSDLAFLSGSSASSESNRAAMREGHLWDMAFPFAYAGYLLILLLLECKSSQRIALIGLASAILIVPFDLQENLSLLAILGAMDTGAAGAELFARLLVATWLKWGAIAIAIGILGILYLLRKSYIQAGLGLATFAIATAAFIYNSKPELLEIMAAMVSLFLLVSFLSQIYTVRKAVCGTNSN